MKNLLIRTATGAVYVALIVAALFIPPLLYVLFLAFALIGVYEYSRMTSSAGDKPAVIYWMVCAALMLLSGFSTNLASYNGNLYMLPIVLTSLLVLACVALPIFELFRAKEHPLQNVANGLWGIVWIALPLTVLSFAVFNDDQYAVLSFFILLWSADTFAFLGGSLLGKHKLCERISPAKTWEGFFVGLLLTVGMAIGLSKIPAFDVLGSSTLKWIGFALLIDVFGTCGDLVESMFKRSAGLKDSGKILPGHGGILDRLDSALLAAIPAMIYFYLVN